MQGFYVIASSDFAGTARTHELTSCYTARMTDYGSTTDKALPLAIDFYRARTMNIAIGALGHSVFFSFFLFFTDRL